ncbi:hypothetical protein Hte_010103 [Hypoxylon texense]
MSSSRPYESDNKSWATIREYTEPFKKWEDSWKKARVGKRKKASHGLGLGEPSGSTRPEVRLRYEAVLTEKYCPMYIGLDAFHKAHFGDIANLQVASEVDAIKYPDLDNRQTSFQDNLKADDGDCLSSSNTYEETLKLNGNVQSESQSPFRADLDSPYLRKDLRRRS